MQDSQICTSSHRKIHPQLTKEISFKLQNDAQKCVSILSLDYTQRTPSQLRLLFSIFETRISYIHNLKNKLQEENMLKLMNCLQLEQHDAFEMIFQQGETGRKMYFILEGEVGILIKTGHIEDHSSLNKKKQRSFEEMMAVQFSNYRLVASKKQYDYFGEIAIEQRILRTASVVTKTKCVFAILTFDNYQKLLRDILEETVQIRQKVIGQIYPFNVLAEHALQQLLHNSEEFELPAKSLIYKKGQKADAIYIIIIGEVLVQRWDKFSVEDDSDQENASNKLELVNLGLLGQGSIFGDFELYLSRMSRQPTNRISQAITQMTSKLYRIKFSYYVDIMRQYFGIKKFDQYLIDKFKNKLESSRRFIKKRNQSTQKYIHEIFEKNMNKNENEQRYFRMVGQYTERKISEYKSPQKTNKLKSDLNLRDKSLLKYLNHAGPLKIGSLKQDISTFSLKNYVKSVKQKINTQRMINDQSSNSYYRIQTEPSMIIDSCKLISPQNLSPKGRSKIYSIKLQPMI